MELLLNLNKLVEKYETEDFIKDDPVQFVHKFSNKRDVEIAGFLASLLAYGNRKSFIAKLNQLFEIMQNEPKNFVENFDEKVLKGFNYRFAKDYDFVNIFKILNLLYKESNLEELFKYGYECDKSILTMFKIVVNYFYSNADNTAQMGFYHMIPNPNNGGAMKRMNMFLRWMIRKPPVDVGIWDFIDKSELLIPLDVHVAKISRKLGLLKRSSNDFKAVLELSLKLKELNLKDPISYDFAIFGYGVNNKD